MALNTGKQKKRPIASEMEQMRNLCYEFLVDDLLSENAAPGDPIPGERILSDRYRLPLRVIRATFAKMKEEKILISEPRKGMRLLALPMRPKSMKGIKLAFLASEEEGNPRAKLNRSAVICSWMERQLNEQGGSLEFINLYHRPNSEKILEMIRDKKMDGLFFASPYDILRKNHLQRIMDSGIPCVEIDSFSEDCFMDSVSFDHRQIGRVMAKHILDYGHKNAVIFHFPEFSWAEKRVEAIRKEYADRGLPEPEIFPFQYRENFEPIVNLPETLKKISRKITAIFCVNDFMAVQVLEQAKKLGISIPERFSVIGADDFLEWRLYNLTTVQLATMDLGVAAYARMKEILLTPEASRDKKQITQPCPLIKRLTTRSLISGLGDRRNSD